MVRDGGAARELSVDDSALFDELRRLRREIATELGMPPYIVFSDVTLEELASARPRDGASMMAVRGVGRARAAALFRGGGTVEAVAKELGRAKSTTMQYLVDFVRVERPSDLSPWVAADDRAKVEAALARCEDGRMKPVFEVLGGAVSYETIKIVMAAVEGHAQPEMEQE